MRFYWLVLGVLSVWRIAHLLSAEDGPWDCIVRLRRRAGEGFWGELMDCFSCSSMWVAAPFAGCIGEKWGERILLWLALSGGAILLERATLGAPGELVPHYAEDKEEHNDVLRPEERTIP